MHACASDTWEFLSKATFPFLTKTTESGRITTVMGMKNTSVRNIHTGIAAALIISGMAYTGAAPLLPLPEDGLPTQSDELKKKDGNVLTDLPDAMAKSATEPALPSAVNVENEGGEIVYDSETSLLTYDGAGKAIKVNTSAGTELLTPQASANMEREILELKGPVIMYDRAVMAKVDGSGSSDTPDAFYDWGKEIIEANGIRAKINGFIVRGSKITYATDTENKSPSKRGQRYIQIENAYVTTDDAESPGTWIGCGTLRIYPGDSARMTRLSIAGTESDIAVPILGWIPIEHSLNPREGWYPEMGSRSTWGGYLLNNYGILLGNRRTDGIMPTADYLATIHADIRTRRGLATGLDVENIGMAKKYHAMTGLESYLVFDRNPMINPQRGKRKHTRHNRYRIALQTCWDITPDMDKKSDWQLATNVNILSDRYVLRDFFEDLSRVDSSPDNTVRVERRTQSTHSMVYTRFAPNNFYASDERLEGTFYRVRQPIANTGITYETRNSAGIMHQYLPIDERISYQNKLNNLKDSNLRAYYERLLNSSSFVRINSTHEFTTSQKILKFLNVTPKAGFGYSGYYGAEDAGADNRFIGYLGVDFDIKFRNHIDNFAFRPYGYKGLTHVFHPYASLSHANLSSSRGLLPQIDSWSSALGSSTNSPMPLDLIGFTGIDAWDSWTIWRWGVRNSINTTVDGETQRVLDWDTSLDYYLSNPLTETEFSNLYNRATLTLTKQTRFYVEMQTPTIQNGDGYNRYNINMATMPFSWLEADLGWRYFKGHPIYQDSEQLETKFNIRFNERYTGAARITWDFTHGRVPIQQFSLFRNVGPWYVGATIFIRDNGGKHEEGFGISFTLSETGTALPLDI